MKKKQLYFLKIGGSIITEVNRPRVARKAIMRRIFIEIKQAIGRGNFDLIIGHGGGSFPHVTADRYKVNEGIINASSRKGAALTALVARELDSIFVNEGLRLGLDLFPFSPSSFGIWDGKAAKSGTVEPIREALRRGMLPVIYGDVVINMDKGVSIASTERVFELLAKKLKPDKIIIATDVDGVFDKDPKKFREAKLIRSINSGNISHVLKLAGHSNKVDVTGGMHTKLAVIYRLVSNARAQGIITNGLKKNRIRDALLGRVGEKATVMQA